LVQAYRPTGARGGGLARAETMKEWRIIKGQLQQLLEMQHRIIIKRHSDIGGFRLNDERYNYVDTGFA